MAELESVYAKQYGANVYHMAQQKGSVLRYRVKLVDMKGEARFFDRVKPTTAVRSTSRYADTPLVHTEFDRRAMHAQEYIWADMIDWQDDLNVFIDPTSDAVAMGGYALGRILDDIIIANAFTGPAYSGKDGLTQVAFPATQQIAVTVGGNGSNVGLNIEKLIQARSLFGKADIDLDDPENTPCMAVTQSQLDDLLRTTQATSADYNSVKALVDGTIHRFMGFEFVRCGRLPVASTVRTCVAWVKSGVLLGVPQDISMSVSQRHDKSDNWQALAKLKAGACRVEDAKVVQVFCKES